MMARKKIFNQKNKNGKFINHRIKKIFATIISIIIGGVIYTNYDYVIDGDTIKVQGKSIRLYAIDAPEKNQICLDMNNNPYQCGIKAKKFLENLLQKRKISCIPKSNDKYQRMVAICYADNIEINKEMVKNGHALAYMPHGGINYILSEKYAKNNKLGIWQGNFEKPWDWRKKNK